MFVNTHRIDHLAHPKRIYELKPETKNNGNHLPRTRNWGKCLQPIGPLKTWSFARKSQIRVRQLRVKLKTTYDNLHNMSDL